MKRKSIQSFVGSVCTIFTTPINRNYKEENPQQYPMQLYNYFMGVIEKADENGVYLRQVAEDLMGFFFYEHIIGIAQEKVLDPDDPNDAKAIKSLQEKVEAAKKKATEAPKPPPQTSQFVDPERLAKLARDASAAK